MLRNPPWLPLLCLAATGSAQAESVAMGHKHALTVEDAVNTSRFMAGRSVRCSGAVISAGEQGRPPVAVISPDGRRYAFSTVQGDTLNNGVWFRVFAGTSNDFRSMTPKLVASTFASGLGREGGVGESEQLLPGDKGLVWRDSEHLLFLWRKDGKAEQILQASLAGTPAVELTSQDGDVVSFCVNKHGDILYSVEDPKNDSKSKELLKSGFAVESQDLFSLLKGSLTENAGRAVGPTRRFILLAGELKPHDVTSTTGSAVNYFGSDFPAPAFSPDGSRALLMGSPATFPAFPRNWATYDDSYTGVRTKAAARGQTDNSYQVLQPYLLDIQRFVMEPLWDAPAITLHGPMTIEWAPDGGSVILAPTFLPPISTQPLGRVGRAAAEVEISTGRFRTIPVPGDAFEKGSPRVRWTSAHSILIVAASGKRYAFSRLGERWKPDVADEIGEDKSATSKAATIQFEVQEGLNLPPALYAIDESTGSRKMLFDPNPQLRSELSLGHVEPVSWNDNSGRTWNGLLYYPVGYQRGKPYPLVIQTHGIGATAQFSLYGPAGALPGTGPGQIGYGAQALANGGIVVLQVEDRWIDGISGTFQEPRMYTAAYEAAVNSLSAKGVVDSNKVGLMGFSRTGWYVEYAISHSSFRYAAALVVDNMDGGYMQAALTGWNPALVDIVGAPPFGQGLQLWLQNSPAFNVQRICTPLQMQIATGGLAGVSAAWEVFSRLRALGRAVELYVIPDVEHGAHNPQNPAQVVASQQRALDWWRFWLLDKADTTAQINLRYPAWKQMRMRMAPGSTADCVRLRHAPGS